MNKLGNTGIIVNKVGLGGIPIQRITKEEAKAVILKAIECGCNFIDSAKGYTCSEEYIGYAINGIRDKVFLATKSMAQTYEKMKEDIMDSLNKFNTSYIDLYQIHNCKNWDQFNTIYNGAYLALKEAKEQGLIKHIGITSHSLDFIDELLDSKYASIIETIQVPYNFIEPQAKDTIKKAYLKGKGTIAMKPLGGGEIERGRVAIKYLCNDKYLSVCIPGVASLDEVNENNNLTDYSLSDEESKYIKEKQESVKGVFCHRCGYCMPCTVGIDIPTIFTFEKYYLDYNLKEWAKARYEGSKVKASSCINCGACVKRCPYGINIPERMKKISELFK